MDFVQQLFYVQYRLSKELKNFVEANMLTTSSIFGLEGMSDYLSA